MFKYFMIAAVAMVGFAGQATAEEITVEKPIQAASLHEGKLDMVAYYELLDNNAMEVTATFVERTQPVPPMRIVMALNDGDKVSFAMPGHPESMYYFERRGMNLTSRVEIIEFSDIAQID